MVEFIGRLANYSRDFINGGSKITFETKQEMPGEIIEKLSKTEKISVKAAKYREKRSLTANGYYWVLVSKIADALRISKSYCHNQMLRAYGQPELFDGQILYVFLADTDNMERQVDESETIHLKPTSKVMQGKKGEMLRMYITLKGSHDYNTEEMSILIDGVVQEAERQGIQTMPKAEIERLVKMWQPGK